MGSDMFRNATMPFRRRFLWAAGWLALQPWRVLRAQPSAPLAFPQRPIQLIVPWPAGGATDLTLRVLAEEVEAVSGQRVVVLNRPGAAGTLVVTALKQAEPDGYTIGQIPLTVYRHALMHATSWDPLVDLSPILQISSTTFGLLVPSSSPWRHWRELLQWARAHPGRLLLGSTGVGTTGHLAMEEILRQEGVEYVHVPYKGTSDHMLALASGDIMAGVNSTGFTPWLEQGKLRLLAIFSARRHPRWPEVPTMAEWGYPQAVYTSPWGLAAPAGTPETIIRRLHDLFKHAAHGRRHREALARYEQELDYLDTAQYQRSIQELVARERRLLARMNLLYRPPLQPR